MTMSNNTQAKSLDDWLDNVNYTDYKNYIPSKFAISFVDFVKLVNGPQGESNVTPPFHYFMLDKMISPVEYIVNLCYRGAAKTSLYGEYMIPFLAWKPKLPYLGDISTVLYIADSMENGAKNLRKNIEHRYYNSPFLQKILPQAKFTDTSLEFVNSRGHEFNVKMFGASTGFRGTKTYGKRPNLCILDDIISNEAGTSKTLMESISDMLYNAVIPAMDPNKKKIILNGTPFSKEDVIVKAVESGSWEVNVFPICEKFPCEKKDFKGAWEDRFPYEYVAKQFEVFQSVGKTAGFYQEYMLRINSAEERLVQESEINWYSRQDLLKVKSNFNFYITTDFATSAKQKADWSVISVWAYNNNGDWFWVDGICEKQTMDRNIDDLFSLVQLYNPASVGVEVTGQQGAFINWLQREMMTRNIFFSFARSGKNKSTVGIRPETDKLTRFNLMVPYFKMGKIFFPEELKSTKIMSEFLGELALVTRNGIKGHDDCIDTISMLAYMNPWKPSLNSEPTYNSNSNYYGFDETDYIEQGSNMDSYIV